MTDPLEQFREAASARGLILSAQLEIGRFCRCDVEGRGGKGDGSYKLYLDGIPAGGFQNWKDGLGWENWHADIGRALTPDEKREYHERMETARREHEAERQRRAGEARATAQAIWRASVSAMVDYPYLRKKGVQPHGLRVTTDEEHGGSLVVPVRDVDGVLHSLQFIPVDGGKKRYLSGSRVSGCYFPIGKPNGVLCVAEGFATAASIHEATGHAVAVAFCAGNLMEVAEALHAKYPELELVICADDDWKTKNNPGMTKAAEAAKAVGCKVAVPDFGPDRPEEGATDFNDLASLRGAEAVKECIEKRMDPSLIAIQPEPVPARPAAASAWTLGDVRRMLREPPPPARWLVPGLIPAGVPGILAGRASVGKSSTALLIGMGLAAGLGVLGREVSAEAARGVVYVSLEDDEEEAHRRLRRASELFAEDPSWNASSMENNLAQRFVPMFPNRASGATFSLESQYQEIADKANAIPGGCGLIVLDTLARLSLGDENSSRDMRSFCEAMAALSALTGATVLAVHHVGKGHDVNTDKKLWERLHPEALRGSSAVEAAARFVIQLASLSPSEADTAGLDVVEAQKGAYVALALSKVSSAEKGSTVLLERRGGDEPGAGFLCPHPESERMLATLQGQAAVQKLVKRDEVLLAIAEAGSLARMDRAKVASAIWPDSPNPRGQLDKQLSGLRKAGLLSDIHLTPAGQAEAGRLGSRNPSFLPTPKGTEGRKEVGSGDEHPSSRKDSGDGNVGVCLKNKDLPPGRLVPEGAEGCLFGAEDTWDSSVPVEV